MSPHDVQPASRGASPLFTDLGEVTAQAAAKPLLAKARGVRVRAEPGLVMTAEPAALESDFHALQAFGETTLTPIEQQIVLMAVSPANRADYSLAIHAALATGLGAAPGIVKAAGTGTAIGDPKLAALRRFTEALTIGRGQIAKAELEAFLDAGYDRTAVVAVTFGIAVKTFANTLAHLAETAVDAPFIPALVALGN